MTVKSLPAESERTIEIVNFAGRRGVTLRVFGGQAIRLHCHGVHREHRRVYQDIDLFGLRQESELIAPILQNFGYSPEYRFNVLHGLTRLKFLNELTHHRIDVFLDTFRMQHILDFRDRLYLDKLTIPLTDLFLTKAQNTELADKDVIDLITLVEDHTISGKDGQELLNATYLANLCANDWPLWKSVTDNLTRLTRLVESDKFPACNKLGFKTKVETIRENIDFAEKNWRWKLRSAVGENVKWYTDVDPS